MINVVCTINDYSTPSPKSAITIGSCEHNNKFIRIEMGDENRLVNAEDLISAVKRAGLGIFGR